MDDVYDHGRWQLLRPRCSVAHSRSCEWLFYIRLPSYAVAMPFGFSLSAAKEFVCCSAPRQTLARFSEVQSYPRQRPAHGNENRNTSYRSLHLWRWKAGRRSRLRVKNV